MAETDVEHEDKPDAVVGNAIEVDRRMVGQSQRAPNS